MLEKYVAGIKLAFSHFIISPGKSKKFFVLFNYLESKSDMHIGFDIAKKVCLLKQQFLMGLEKNF